MFQSQTVASPSRIRLGAVQEPTVAGSHATGRDARLCSATTNDPLAARTDRNTARGRRIADLFRGYMAALDNPSDAITQANVLTAAELKVAAEDARKRLLNGEGADVDDLVRLENAASRAVKALGIKPGAEHKAPSLAEHLARKYGGGAT